MASRNTRLKTCSYTEEAMQAACQAVSGQRKGLREAGRLYGVPPSTLKDRLKGRKSFHEVERTVITAREEERLVQWIRESANRGSGRTMSQVQRAVQSVLNDRGAVTLFKDNLPGKKWTSLFLKRHKDVTLHTPQTLESERAAIRKEKLRGWFEEAFTEIQAVGGDVLDHPSRIFNCNETGFQHGGGGFTKVVANKGDRVHQASTDIQARITVLACGSASGVVHKPLIIFPGKRFNFDPLEGFPEAHFVKSNNGWIDGDIFAGWLRTAFVPATKHLPKPVVLFADSHKTNMTLTVSELCREHNIILYQLPSRPSHIVQPLNLALKVFKQVWREEVLKFQEESSDTVGKKEFSGVLKKAWERGVQKDVVISGFRASGLYPWNLDHVDLTKLEPSKLFATSQEDNVTIPAELVFEPMEVTEVVPKVRTATKTLTVTAVEQYNDVPVDPSSRTSYLSAQPPLSPSPAAPPHVSSPQTASTSAAAPYVTSPPTASTSVYRPSTSTSVAVTSKAQALDRLLDLAAKAGVNRLIRYRTLHTLGTETNDPEEGLFCLLYSQLKREIDSVDTGPSADRQRCDNLPLPSRCTQKKRPISQSPKIMVSSDAFRQDVTEVNAKKRKQEEDEERKKEREERQKRMEEEKERKERTEEVKERKERAEEEKEGKKQERRKREREEKRAEQEKAQEIKKSTGSSSKKTQTEIDGTSDSVTMTV